MIIKLGEAIEFDPTKSILTPQQALSDKKIAQRFMKMAKDLKRIAPKAQHFCYASTVMMTAAERSLLNDDGTIKLNSKGEPVRGWFEDFKNEKGQDSIRWVSPDDLKPYKNANGDIFGEDILIEAHKKWVGRPLCLDHRSDSVDHIRGIVVDTYYDKKTKHVYALFALDKKNYPDLSRKVEAGYANSVSMGTGVGRSICTECGNVAITERDYCQCIKTRANYGEINVDLSPIELSLVVNGADGLAKIRQVIASMNSYVDQKQARIDEMKNSKCVNPTELQALADSLKEMQTKINGLMNIEKTAGPNIDMVDEGRLVALLNRLDKEDDPEIREILKARIAEIKNMAQQGKDVEQTEEAEPMAVRPTSGGSATEYRSPAWTGNATEVGFNPGNRLASNKEGGKQGANSELGLLRSKIESLEKEIKNTKSVMEENHMNSKRLKARAMRRRAYWQGGGGVNEPTPGKPKYEKEDSDKIRDTEDKQMVGEPLDTGSDGLHPGDMEVKKKWLRAEELADRKMKRRAYWQGGGGVNEPTPGKPKYEKEDSDKIRDTEDKQMVGTPLDTGSDGLHPGDMEVKKKWLRAALKAKFTKAANKDGTVNKGNSKWEFFAGDKMILQASGNEIYADELEANWDFLKSASYAKKVMQHIREDGFERVAYLLKGAADPVPADPAAGGDLGALPEMPEMPEAEAPAAEPAVEAPAPEGDDVEVKQEKGETQQKVDAALGVMEEKIAELRDLVSEVGSDELVDIDVNISDDEKGEAAPAAEPAAGELDQVLSASKEDIMKVEALMDLSADELAEASETLDNLDKIPESAHSDVVKAALEALEDSEKIVAKADVILAAKKKDKKEEDKDEEKKDKKEEDKDEEKEDKKDKKDEKDDEKKSEAQKLLDDALKVRAENRAQMLAMAMGEEYHVHDTNCAEDCADDDLPGMPALDSAVVHELDEVGESAEKILSDVEEAKTQSADDKDKDEKKDKKDEDEEEDDKDEKKDKKDEEDEDDAMFVLEPQADVVAARKRDRDELIARAADALGKAENCTEKTFYEAHPGGKGTVTELTHTKTPEAKVETISEVHEIMRDVAESGPRNVREAAEKINEYIVKGAMSADDLEKLVAEGKVDSAAAAYWKKYFGQAPDAGSFGADLSKEFAAKKKEASIEGYKAKLRRAYDIGLEAQEKGIINASRKDLDKYVDEIMQFDDASFESTKRVVASYNAAKTSGSVPRVGMNAASEPMAVVASPNKEEPVDLVGQLTSLFK